MDAITIQPIAVPALPKAAAPSAPVLPKADPQPIPGTEAKVQANVEGQVQAAEQRRFDTVKRLANGIANVYVVSDRRFTIFKDTTGQYVTRFTDLRSGKVTYVPEPELFKNEPVPASVSLQV